MTIFKSLVVEVIAPSGKELPVELVAGIRSVPDPPEVVHLVHLLLSEVVISIGVRVLLYHLQLLVSPSPILTGVATELLIVVEREVLLVLAGSIGCNAIEVNVHKAFPELLRLHDIP